LAPAADKAAGINPAARQDAPQNECTGKAAAPQSSECLRKTQRTVAVTTCGRFSTLPTASSACADTLTSPAGTSGRTTSHSAKLALSALAFCPLTRTFATVSLSAVVPRTVSWRPDWPT